MRVRAWRIVQRHLAGRAFDGEGARLYGGRWNHRGVPVVYTAASLALAALEMMVHLESTALLGKYVCIPVEFEDSLCRHLDEGRLPRNWRVYPAPAATKDIGSRWARELEAAVLAVPSAIIPAEKLYLLNPAHPDFGKIAIGKPMPFKYDPRLIRS